VKKNLPLIVTIAVLVLFSTMALTASVAQTESPAGIKISLDGKLLSMPGTQPVLTDGRVLIPMRGVFSALGADVSWDGRGRTIKVNKGGTTIEIMVDKKTAYLNGQLMNPASFPTIMRGVTMVPLQFITEALGATAEWQDSNQTVVIDTRLKSLPVLGSYANLKALLADVDNRRALMDEGVMAGGMPLRNNAVKSAESAAPQAAKEYSKTNVQVQGVDEADIVKTDGRFIYQVNNQRVIVAQAYPAGELKITSLLKFDNERFAPQELYVDQKYLVVIGANNEPVRMAQSGVSAKPEIYPPVFMRGTVKAIVYDLSNKSNIKKLREFELEGSYVSSRKIGSSLYLVANRYINYYYIMDASNKQAQPTESPLPSYRDTAAGDGFVQIGYKDIRYFPGCVEPNYLMIAALNLDGPNEEAQVSTYLGAGNSVYASPQNLYVAAARYEINNGPVRTDKLRAPGLRPPVPAADTKTDVFKFALDQGRVTYKGKGEVPGTTLNQFSMDEYEGHFRIATTRGEAWRSDNNTSKNNVYILDGGLNTVGKLEGIAPGERIYSVRFMGSRGYMVTFKQVDPLFVIDLKNPQSPKILGALKIPGYSNYLHPYDENHIIGFGKDTIELAPKDWQGKPMESMAFYQGMKMAIFDVSDVRNPVEKFVAKIGDRGTDSDLLWNHKALLFAKDKNLLAFPVTVMQVEGSSVDAGGIPAYGHFAFQGAYVYNIDLVKGFTLKGRITHLTGDDYLKAGNSWYDGSKNIDRILFIDDALYTLSKQTIRAHQIATLKEINSLEIPREQAN